MKNMTKNKDKLYTLVALVMIIGFLAFLQSDTAEYSYQVSILERSTIYAVVTVSMSLLTDSTGLLSLGQAGFAAIGAYVVAVLTIPVGSRASIYCVSGMSSVTANIQLPILVALLLDGLATATMAAPTEIPVLRLKNDYLAITTLGFSEIIRAFVAAPMFDTVTSGSYGLKNIPGFPNIFAIFGLAALCIVLMALLINSSYGRAFKSIRGDEVAAQFMGIDLFHYKELSLVISSFLTGVRGGMLATFIQSVDSKTFQVALTYDILLIMVLDGIGNVTGSVAGAFLVTANRELLRFSDDSLTIAEISVPLFRPGFRMVIFSVLLVATVLLYSHDVMGSHEFSQDGLFRFIQGIPDKFKRGREKPSSAKRRGIH